MAEHTRSLTPSQAHALAVSLRVAENHEPLTADVVAIRSVLRTTALLDHTRTLSADDARAVLAVPYGPGDYNPDIDVWPISLQRALADAVDRLQTWAAPIPGVDYEVGVCDNCGQERCDDRQACIDSVLAPPRTEDL